MAAKKLHAQPAYWEEMLGWYGAFAIIFAYALVSFDFIETSSLAYQLLNLSGALGIVVISYAKKLTQTLVLNIFWAAIAVGALVVLLF